MSVSRNVCGPAGDGAVPEDSVSRDVRRSASRETNAIDKVRRDKLCYNNKNVSAATITLPALNSEVNFGSETRQYRLYGRLRRKM